MALAHDADFDRRAFRTAHAPDGIRKSTGIRGDAVDRHDDVAGTNSRLRGRRAVKGRDHHDLLILDGQLDADTGITPRAADLDLVVFVAVEICRIRIQ